MDHQNPLPTPSQRDSARPDQHAEGSPAPVGINRRALLRGGAAASPILLTLASGPVAATGNCVVASSFVSASVYKSRSPGSTNIACVPKTAKNWCDEAKSTAQGNCNWNPHNRTVSYYVTSTAPTEMFAGWPASTMCYHVFRNSGNGLANSGDVAILQRLLALSHGAPTVFTKDYCKKVWSARSNASLMAALVNDGGTTPWDQTRLLAWLDYSSNGVALP